MRYQSAVPDYTLTAPLTLRNEERYLGLKLREQFKVPTLKPKRTNTLLNRDYNWWRSQHAIGDVDVVKIWATLRSSWEVPPDTVDLIWNKMQDLEIYPALAQKLCRDIDRIFEPADSDKHKELKGTMTRTYFGLIKSSMSSDVKLEFAKFFVLDQALIWSNMVEESGEYDISISEECAQAGWSLEEEEDIHLISQFIEIGNTDEFVHLIVTGSTVGLISTQHNDVPLVMPKTFLLAERDLYYQRWMTKLWVILGSKYPSMLRLPESRIIAKLYKWGDNVLARAGNKGFDVIKELETFFLGKAHHTLELDEATHLSDGLWKFINREVKSLLTDLNLDKYFSKLKDLLMDMNYTVALELSGLFRHWGHPCIEVEEGLAAIQKNATEILPQNAQLMKELAVILKIMILRDYYRKHNNSWPPDANIPNPITPNEVELKKYIDEDMFPSEEVQKRLGMSWLSVIHNSLIENLDEIPVAALIADRRHAKTRDQIERELKKSDLEKISATASVIETFILTPQIDPLQFLKEVNKRGIKKKYLVIVLKEKERELKRKGRFFSLMTFVLRLYFVSTEWLIEKYILPLFPEITMCKDQLDFTQQLLNSAEKDKDQELVTHHMISIDFEKWNNFQREESTFEVFKVMDEMFGFKKVISRTHYFFKNCVVLHGNSLDKIPRDLAEHLPYCWYNHLGGFEGLRQKGWSVIGALMIRKISDVTKTTTRVLLQGDNQVIILRYLMNRGMTNDEYVATKNRHRLITKRFLDLFSDNCNSIGLRTKSEETWMSAHLLYYGKTAIIDGTVQSLFLKRICRSFFLTNDVAPSLGNSLGALNTSLLASCYQIHDPLICYAGYLLLGSYLVGVYMRYDPVLSVGLYDALCARSEYYKEGLLKRVDYDRSKKISVSSIFDPITEWAPHKVKVQSLYLMDLLIRDASLGGIGGAGVLRYWIRQFPDPVTESLTGLKKLYENTRSKKLSVLYKKIGNPIISDHINYEVLLQDPLSLNLMSAATATNVIRGHIKEILTSNSKKLIGNNALREALNIEETGKTELIDFIMSIRPVFTRFLGELYSASPYSCCATTVNKVSNTRSAFRLTIQEQSPDSLRAKLIQCEVANQLSLIYHHLTSEATPWLCSSQKAQMLRDNSWGVNIVGMTVPHPFEQWRLSSSDGHFNCQLCNINSESMGNPHLVLVPDQFNLDRKELPWSCGSFTPYLGGHTKTKRIAQSEIEVDTSSSYLRSIIRLYNCANWAFQESESLHRCIEALIDAYIPNASSYLSNLIDITSGNLIHRFSNSRISDGAVLGVNPNLISHACITSNKLGALGQGEENYIIMFQGVFLFYLQLFALNIWKGLSIPLSAHVHLGCAGCLIPAEDFSLTTESTYQPVSLSSLLTSEQYEGRVELPPIPENALIRSNPFLITLDQIYVNPLAFSSAVEEEKMPQYETVEDAVYLGTAVTILSKLNFLGNFCLTGDYKLSVSLLRSLQWIRLKRVLIQVSLLITALEVYYRREKLSQDSREIFQDIVLRCIDGWSRTDQTGLGMVLSNSGLERNALQENVAHNASFPAKNAQIGKSGVGGIILELINLSTFDLPDLYIIPGDFNTVQTVLFLMTSHAAFKILCDYTKNEAMLELLSQTRALVRTIGRVKITEVSAKRPLLQQLQDLGELTGVNVRFIKKDLKSLSTLLNKGLDSDVGSTQVEKFLSPLLRKVKSAVCCWSPETILLERAEELKEIETHSQTQLKSPLLHIFRPIWHSANGSAKIASLLKVIPKHELRFVAVIGDGNGGFGRVIASQDECEKLWFNSLPELLGLTDQQGASGVPSALVGSNALQLKTVNIDSCLEGILDVTDKRWPCFVLSDWKRLNFIPTLLICDAEFYSREGMIRLWSNLSGIKEIVNKVIVKMHLDPEFGVSSYLQNYKFSDIKIWRSPYSNMGRFEVYVEIQWYQRHGNITNGDAIAPDRILMNRRSLFLFTPKDQLRALDDYRYPTRNKGERNQLIQAGLSLRLQIHKILKIPVSQLIEKEMEIRVKRYSPLKVYEWLLHIMFSSYFNKLNFRSELSRVGDIRLKRVDIASLTAAQLGILIFLSALLRSDKEYEITCKFYTYGMHVNYSIDSLGSIRPEFFLRDDRKSIFDFTAVELKPNVHDVVRYMSSLWWASGRKRFRYPYDDYVTKLSTAFQSACKAFDLNELSFNIGNPIIPREYIKERPDVVNEEQSNIIDLYS
ncbi:MAG: RNA-dependent RNA polymerase [Wufeng shrew rhabdovirus 5]|nr:MAG: RNA-dependent RNA polymerase [Wufeng shrew rhabdovirus 5]